MIFYRICKQSVMASMLKGEPHEGTSSDQTCMGRDGMMNEANVNDKDQPMLNILRTIVLVLFLLVLCMAIVEVGHWF
jgi:hypothetical protein